MVASGERGFCGCRENRSGIYYTLVYARPAELKPEPLEHHPLFHFLPGRTFLCFGTTGCNLSCAYCISWELSQSRPEEVETYEMSPEQVVGYALQLGCQGMAYSYVEPVTSIEFVLDTAQVAKRAGLYNVCHTAGFVKKEPLQALCQAMDAINIDFKGFTDEFYREVCGASLGPVLHTLEQVAATDVHLEVTALIVPGYNDNAETFAGMCAWLVEHVRPDVPFFVSRFFPAYRMKDLAPTPLETLEALRKVAYEQGLQYVYLGNVPGHAGQSTYCPVCGVRLVHRVEYEVREITLVDGCCPVCGIPIPGRWS